MTQIKELFDKLLTSELLTEETKADLSKEFDSLLEATVAAKVEEAKDTITLELTEQFVADKEALIEAIDSKVDEQLTKELENFKESIEQYKDLEVEYAEKLVEAKREMAESVKADMTTLVERVNEFLEERLVQELTELRESIEEARTNTIGKKLTEALIAEYGEHFAPKEDNTAKLAEAQAKLEEQNKVLESVNRELNAAKREQELTSVLETLQGRPREVMEAILKNVPTEKLKEQFSKFIGRVLHESVTVEENTDTTEKENGEPLVLAEGKVISKVEEATRVVTGDKEPVVESVQVDDHPKKVLKEETVNRIKQLAGIE